MELSCTRTDNTRSQRHPLPKIEYARRCMAAYLGVHPDSLEVRVERSPYGTAYWYFTVKTEVSK